MIIGASDTREAIYLQKRLVSCVWPAEDPTGTPLRGLACSLIADGSRGSSEWFSEVAINRTPIHTGAYTVGVLETPLINNITLKRVGGAGSGLDAVDVLVQCYGYHDAIKTDGTVESTDVWLYDNGNTGLLVGMSAVEANATYSITGLANLDFTAALTASLILDGTDDLPEIDWLVTPHMNRGALRDSSTGAVVAGNKPTPSMTVVALHFPEADIPVGPGPAGYSSTKGFVSCMGLSPRG